MGFLYIPWEKLMVSCRCSQQSKKIRAGHPHPPAAPGQVKNLRKPSFFCVKSGCQNRTNYGVSMVFPCVFHVFSHVYHPSKIQKKFGGDRLFSAPETSPMAQWMRILGGCCP